jgi:hypothetical protein
MTIEQTVEIPANYKIFLELPHSVPSGVKASVKIDIPASPAKKTNKSENIPVFGCLKGQIKMSDDFDEPLEDFKDYM